MIEPPVRDRAASAAGARPFQSVQRLGITGTDTGVGKTVVACALAVRARQLGLRVAAMKPIETGLDAFPLSDRATDAERLREAAGGDDPLSVVRPCAFGEPLAPMVAAARAGVTINLSALDAAVSTLTVDRDVVLVEGAGGLLVPITVDVAFIDLFVRWHCDLVLVAANKLGALNHVLLTLRAAAAGGVAVRGIVLVDSDAAESSVAAMTNHDALVSLLPHQAVFRFPWLRNSTDPDALATAIAASGLDVLLFGEPAVPTAPGTLFLD